MVAALAAAFFSGASVSPGRAKPVDERKPATTVGQKIAVFNMAAVMRDFHQAKHPVWLLSMKKLEASENLVTMRAEYLDIQQELQKNPDAPDMDAKEKQRLKLARAIEEEDRAINKQINEDATATITGLYDKMKAVVDGIAQEGGFQLVLAYPDAVTREERENPYIKELKLKPPAAQPFYVAPEIDLTARVVKAPNEKYPAIDPRTKEPVDVDKLPMSIPLPGTPLKIELAPGTGGPRKGP